MPAKDKYSLLHEDEDEDPQPSSSSSTSTSKQQENKTTTTNTNTLKKSQTHSPSPDLRKSIGIIVETSPGVMPPLNLDPTSIAAALPPVVEEVPPPIQAVQVKAMKSKAVAQIQDLLSKRRKKNKKNWKQNAILIAVVLSALAGALFTLVGMLFYFNLNSFINLQWHFSFF